MTLQELCSMGGNARSKKYGRQAFVDMGKKGAASLKEKKGPDYFINLSKMGIEARRLKKLNKLH